MISMEELRQIKEKRRTTLYYAEKEYLQYVFLHAISRFSENFVFKGGTCLRICYDFERASEDLDFNTNLGLQETKKTVKTCLKNFELLNIEHTVFAEKEFEGNIRFEARFKGPLYNGQNSSTNTLKIDFNKSKAKGKTAKAIPKLFSDIPVFTIQALSLEEMLTEKIRALINRGEARDLYDVWMLLQNKIAINKKLLKQKLSEEKSNYPKTKFPTKEEYETSLKNLLEHLPAYEQIKKEVKQKLDKTMQKPNN
ncbi:MAG: nucleotidyl transferase AbiEii/AbiGii toxin family protein [Candidatus ainarchaeum sp.]|nr:nucleotidyl transferase AbiEii/AbiGii toxin family protein [Candidatus ainarchaeum sp.]